MKIGDIVHKSCYEKTYAWYNTWLEHYAPEYQSEWIQGDDASPGDYRIVAQGRHLRFSEQGMLYLIRSLHKPQVYIVNHNVLVYRSSDPTYELKGFFHAMNE